jgi:pimeloyl-ACP methyl ester carboxylesterase
MTLTPSEERTARLGDVELAYQTIGDSGDPPMVLVMGLGAQMILLPDRLCELLAGRGFFVVRFDNRDCGRSSILDELGAPSLQAILRGARDDVSYTLSEMAGDAAALLDSLGIAAAHLVGASLGGMIAQTLAIERPERVLSLASIMSTTGNLTVGQATAEAREVLMARTPV